MKRIKRLCESSNGSGRLSRPADLLFTLFPVARTYVKFRESRSSDSCESFSDRYSESRLPERRAAAARKNNNNAPRREGKSARERGTAGGWKWEVEGGNKKGNEAERFHAPCCSAHCSIFVRLR